MNIDGALMQIGFTIQTVAMKGTEQEKLDLAIAVANLPEMEKLVTQYWDQSHAIIKELTDAFKD
jgi:hypothetical protein